MVESPLTQINRQLRYYQEPVIEKLSEFEKGAHKGRAEGLMIAKNILLNWVEEYRRNELDKTDTSMRSGDTDREQAS